MAIRSSWFKNLIVSGSLALFRAWWSTLRIHIVCPDTASDPRGHSSQLILSMWHEDLVAGCVSFRNRNLKVLVSHSNDGNYITRTIEGIGFSTIRGSSKRGGAQALREMIRAVGENCIAITPDGPTGPRREVKEGITYLASRAEAPIVALGCAYSNGHRFRSWDQTVLMWPWSRVVIYVMPRLEVPRSSGKDELDGYTAELQQRMKTAQTCATQILAEWQRTGRPPAMGIALPTHDRKWAA
jgi:lysophospholipid acyltransferase (LPLAT)-like uncharacterized protein